MQSSEKIFYQKNQIIVTQSRFIYGPQTYAMRNISSVSLYVIEKSRLLPIILIITGGICIISRAFLLGGVLVVIGALILYLVKNEYSVRIQSNAGEVNTFKSTNRLLVQEIVDAVNEAIIFRG